VDPVPARPVEPGSPTGWTAGGADHRPASRRRWRRLGAPLLCAIVLAGAGLAFFALRLHADAITEATTALARIEAETAQERLLERQAVLGRRPAAALAERGGEARRRARAAAGVLARTETAAGPAEGLLRLLALEAPETGRVRAGLDAFHAALDEELRLLGTGRMEAAAALAAETGQRLDELARAIEDAGRAHGRIQPRAGRAATAAGVVALGGGSLVLALVFVSARRGRAAAERLVVERETLRGSEERFRSLVQHAAEVIALVEPDGTIRHVSPAVQTVLGQAPEKLVGTKAWDLAHPGDVDAAHAFHSDLLGEAGTMRALELRWRHRDGSWRHVSVKGTNLVNQPGVHGIVLNARDVTEQKALEQQLVHRALHDQLTGLPNRMLFMDRLEHALATSARGNRSVAVLFLDLDRFKLVNDSFGHDRGDKLLVEVANRLRHCVRQADTIARLGGDEFTVLLEGVVTSRDATVVADRIIEAFRKPFSLEHQEVFVGASIGIALGSFGADAAQGLLRNADVAMYRAKANGRAQYEVFKTSMRETMRGRLQLEAELRRAIERGELEVHYQPKVDLESERLVGLEALVRWAHPARGLIPPGQFIPVAEETGLILPLDRFVLETACRQARTWRTTGLSEGPLVIAVNLSAQQFRNPRLAEEVTRVLADSGLDPDALEIEITESTAMGNANTTAQTLERLKGIGVRLAIDDFGTGYSSLGYLRRFPLDVLKVDRSFVGGLPANRGDAAIVQAVVAVARALGLKVVAEGVETTEQLVELRSLGCDMGQGYFFGKPVPAGAIEARLQQPVSA
jgi:diguanylate cyclase (GGDEF)-like protein/PAS domain S-box-containing protein